MAPEADLHGGFHGLEYAERGHREGLRRGLAEARHDTALAAREIAFVPDYLANAGGVIDFHQETIDDRPNAVLAEVAHIGAITRDLLRYAAETGVTPLSVADGIVRARIRRA